MRVIRATQPETTLTYLRDKLTPPDGIDLDNYCEIIKYKLENDSESIAVFVTFDEDEETVRGFLLALTKPNFLLIHDSWLEADWTGGKEAIGKMFLRLVVWAEAVGYKEIRLATDRPVSPITDLWNFSELSRILSYTIPEHFESRVIEELSNGRGLQNGLPDRPGSAIQATDIADNGLPTEENCSDDTGG